MLSLESTQPQLFYCSEGKCMGGDISQVKAVSTLWVVLCVVFIFS